MHQLKHINKRKFVYGKEASCKPLSHLTQIWRKGPHG